MKYLSAWSDRGMYGFSLTRMTIGTRRTVPSTSGTMLKYPEAGAASINCGMFTSGTYAFMK